jgi:hypothetical protein
MIQKESGNIIVGFRTESYLSLTPLSISRSIFASYKVITWDGLSA